MLTQLPRILRELLSLDEDVPSAALILHYKVLAVKQDRIADGFATVALRLVFRD